MTIQLGFELGTGKPVNIPIRHTAVTGQTQESGKTTTLEAMITRSGLRAVCFVTKRGEGSFSTGRAIMPYFRESADWRFVESILEATMRERMKFQRSWIMKLCEPFHDKHGSWGRPSCLQDVAANTEIALEHARGLNESVYRELREYLRIVIPQIKKLPKTDAVDVKPGINVMWLDDYSLEMQALIIRSVLEWIIEKETRVVTVIPEAWRFLPQGRSSPVLLACEHLIRQGAANQNYIWLDSQDIAGIQKAILRQVGVWILGVQREIHETERTLDHLPGGLRKPRLDEVMKLGKGQFFVTYGDEIRKTYVWPVWLTADEACAVAYTNAKPPAPPASLKHSEDAMWRERAEKAEEISAILKAQLADAHGKIAKLQKDFDALKNSAPIPSPTSWLDVPLPNPSLDPRVQLPAPLAPEFIPSELETADSWFARIWPLVREKCLKDPASATVLSTVNEIEIKTKRKRVELDGDTLRGRIALMIAEGFFDGGKKLADAFAELRTRGVTTAGANLSRELKSLTTMGFLTSNGNTQATSYKRVPGLKITRTKIETE